MRQTQRSSPFTLPSAQLTIPSMLNHRLAALLVFLACVISPLTIHWITTPGASWLRPYFAWLLVIIASWLWQRRRGRYER